MNAWTFIWKFTTFLLWLSTFTPSERVALAATFLVFVGVAGEYVIELPKIEKRPPLRTKIKRLSMALLLLGLAGDILGVVMGQAEMAALTQEAGDAQKSATGAAIASAAARADAKTAHDEAKAAGALAASAKGDAQNAKQETARLSAESAKIAANLSAAQSQLAAVENKRVVLEQSLRNLAICNAPRVIPFWGIVGNRQESSIDPLRQILKTFSGIEVAVEFVSDAEARRAAFNISGALGAAGWTVRPLIQKDGPEALEIKDGVTVRAFVGRVEGSILPAWNALEAADGIVDFLQSYNWQATELPLLDKNRHFVTDPTISPPNLLRIQVGLYPPVTFVTPPAEKHFAEANAELEAQREANRQNIEAQDERRERAFLAQMSPEEIERFKKDRDERKARQKIWRDRFTGPCRPLEHF